MPKEQPKSITSDLVRFLNKRVRIRLSGGREVVGVLKGHDSVVDLVLDDITEYLRGQETQREGLLKKLSLYTDPSDPHVLTQKTRYLGLVVVKGTAVVMISPEDGTEEVANPFVVNKDEDSIS